MASLHSHTPTLAVFDPRGLAVRTVGYCRSAAEQVPVASIVRHGYDERGRNHAAWDARFWAAGGVPNRSSRHALSGAEVLNHGSDAGWRLVLLSATGKVSCAWDGRGSRTLFTHDPLDRPLTVCEQAAGEGRATVERFSYGEAAPELAQTNQCGRLVRHDDPAGSLFLEEYALSGQPVVQSRCFLTSMQTPDWPAVPGERDELIESASPYLTRTQCNALGEPVVQVDALGNRQVFAHTAAGALSHLDLLLTGTQQSLPVREQIDCNAFGQVVREVAGNGIVTTRQFCAKDARLLRLTLRAADNRVLQDLRYEYDGVGNICGIDDLASPVTFHRNQRVEPQRRMVYDSLYRLIEAHGVEVDVPAQGPHLPPLYGLPLDPSRLINYQQRFTYDAAGNLLQRQHSGAAGLRMAVARDSNRCLPQRADGSLPDEQEIAEGFDACGNLLSLQGVAALRWNLRNQLCQVLIVERAEGAADEECYAYDAAGKRLRKLRRSRAAARMHHAETRWLPGLELLTDSATGEQRQVIVVGTQVRVLRWTAGRPGQVPNDQLRYQVDDHLGSVALEFDGQAQLLTRETFYPFGGTAIWAGNNALQASYKSRRFSGKERDATGLYYFGLRYYAPWLSRWINPDPLGEVDGLNLFCMVKNNPVTLRDANGGSAVPQVAHFYWGGSTIPPEHLYNVLMFKEMNPEWTVNMWVARPSQLVASLMAMEESMDAAARYLALFNGDEIVHRDPQEMFAELARSEGLAVDRLQAIFERESQGAYANHAAASDVFRLGLMYAYGGLYMDMDVAVAGPVELGNANGDFFMHTQYKSYSNAVLASIPGSQAARELLQQVLHEYSPESSKNGYLPLIAWSAKRSKMDEGEFTRVKITMGMTGPTMIRQVLGNTRLERDGGVLPADRFYRREVVPHSERPEARSTTGIFFSGYIRGLDGRGTWGEVHRGRSASIG